MQQQHIIAKPNTPNVRPRIRPISTSGYVVARMLIIWTLSSGGNVITVGMFFILVVVVMVVLEVVLVAVIVVLARTSGTLYAINPL